jgi:hypothetical protein
MYIKLDEEPQQQMPIFTATALWLVKWKCLNEPSPVTEVDYTHYHKVMPQDCRSDCMAMMNRFCGAGTV